MIDMHSHILPGVDDGAVDMEDAIAMARIAAEDGTKVMFATSHSAEWFELGPLSLMQQQVDGLQQEIDKAGIDLKVVPGMEIFLSADTGADLKSGRAWTRGGARYILVELASENWPPNAEQVLFGIQMQGYIPILAHPERYTIIQRNTEFMYDLAERGVLGQVTGIALTGQQGNTIRNCAEALVQRRLVQFIASDSHDIGDRYKRLPGLTAGVAAAAALIGEEAAQRMVTTAPQHILDKKPLATNALPPEEKKKGFFQRMMGRG